MKLKIKKGDTVQIIAGAEKGKKGAVLEVVQKKTVKIRIQGICMMTHFDKKEGVRQKEGLIDYSNIKLVEASKAAAKTAKKKSSATK